MQNQLVLQDVRKFKAEKQPEHANALQGVYIQTRAQTESVENKESEGDADIGTSSESRDESKANLEDLLNSCKSKSTRRLSRILQTPEPTSEQTSSQLTLTTQPTSEETSSQLISEVTSSQFYSRTISSKSKEDNFKSSSRRESAQNSRQNSTLGTSLATNTRFTGDVATNETLQRLDKSPPINWLGYMTRGFKFSYFEYCSN